MMPIKSRFVHLAFALWMLIPLSTGRLEAAQSEAGPPDHWLVYIGSYTGGESEGIYLLKLDAETGALENLGLAGKATNPSFLAFHPTLPILYSTGNMGGAEGIEKGGVSAHAIGKDGRLTALNHQSSIGDGPCHVTVDRAGRHVLLANYSGGSLTAIALDAEGKLGESTSYIEHTGSSVHPDRQKQPHAHSVNLDTAGKFAFVADLGIDQVVVYRFDDRTGKLEPNDPPFAQLAPGAGPRHFAFHPSGKFAFVINELDNTLTAFAYDEKAGRLKTLDTAPTLPADFTDPNTTAEVRVHPNGRFVYGSNRGHDSIASFEFDIDSGKLKSLGWTSTEGEVPRNFNLDPTGTFLLAANQRTDNVVVLRIDPETGIPAPTGIQVKAPTPVCVLFLDPRGLN